MFDFAQATVAVLLIAGVVELINRVRAQDYWTVVTIVSAALVGLVLGLLHFYVPDAITGIAFGLATSGLVTVAGSIKSAAVARPPVVTK
jgi:hydrogenase/urease accessory protein HupE